MKKNRKPNGKNIEISLELLELSLIIKSSVKLAEEAVERAVSAKVFDKRVKVASPEYLILLKLLPLSLQDEVDISALLREADLKELGILAEKHSLLMETGYRLCIVKERMPRVHTRNT